MKKILPILLAIVGLAIGGGVGFVLRPAPEPIEVAEDEVPEPGEKPPLEIDLADHAYVKINNQFVVPVVKNSSVVSLVVLSVSLETDQASTEMIYNHEPKLPASCLIMRLLMDLARISPPARI